jgi:hypothetical protein
LIPAQNGPRPATKEQIREDQEMFKKEIQKTQRQIQETETVPTQPSGNIGIAGEVQGAPFDGTIKKFSTWSLAVKYGLSENLSLIGNMRTSRSRSISVEKPDNSPVDGGTAGIAYRTSPFFGIAIGAGLMTRKNPSDKNEIGWLTRMEILLGYITPNNYYLKKQVFCNIAVEKGQWGDVYVDARGIYPMLDIVAVGVRYESDLGWGPHGEIKIPLAEQEAQKAIYAFCTYYMDQKTTVVGVRLTLN